ncbi:MAG: Bax inhibitor-1/YccA family protein [Bacteroidales bacterium]|nr:Bax inhibitor-1/YccA family protein [Bacteroidales bacterium]
MYNENQYNTLPDVTVRDQSMVRTFMSGVFTWMFIALALTAVTAFLVAQSPAFLSLLVTETGLSIFGWIVMLAPLGFVMLMSFRFQKLSPTALSLLFIVYAFLVGVSLSFIFLVYSIGSIAVTFGVTSLTFGVMAVAGYTTKTDLTKFGSIMMMGLVGIIIASLINFFLKSDSMQYIISFIGVLVFTGLTAYDVQKLKNLGSEMIAGQESTRKYAIMGALSLYLDFINLFLFLLRFLGKRN